MVPRSEVIRVISTRVVYIFGMEYTRQHKDEPLCHARPLAPQVASPALESRIPVEAVRRTSRVHARTSYP